ncbi:MAG: Gfo/Idh/MocA family oxidoreductase [Actinobacteria bacterium]|nr:Gfo/Idh/MocA family oxidoreductase [Actinomycetota bacterium]
MADRVLKVGFIGCGGISRLYTDIYAGMTDLAQVVATADIVPNLAKDRAAAIHEAYAAEAHRQQALVHNARTDEQRQTAQRAWAAADAAARSTIRTYDGHEALLKDPEVEAVAILTTPPVRGVPVVAAAQAGKHIFTEGPMAKSVQEADEILAAVQKAGVTYVSQCGGRYTRGIAHARQAIASGLMGPLAVAKLEINWYHQQTYYRGWHGTFATEGGGAVFHHGRYVIEPFLYALGSPVVEVTAYSGAFLREIEHDSYSLALVRYANGAVGIVQGSLLHHEHPQTRQARMEFVGQNASMVVIHEHLGPTNPAILLGTGRESVFHHEVSFGSTNTPGVAAKLQALADGLTDLPESPSQLDQSRLWARCVLEKKPVPVPQTVARQHVELTRAIYKSAATAATVRLPLDKGDPYYTFEGRLPRPEWMPKLPK